MQKTQPATENALVRKNKKKSVSSPRSMIMAIVTVVWISLVISLVQILGIHFLYHRPMSVSLIVDTCFMTVSVFLAAYGTWMLCLWLLVRGLFFKFAAVLIIVIGVTALVLLGVFNAFKAEYAHIIVISSGMIALGIAVWYSFVKKKKQAPLSVKEEMFTRDLTRLFEELKKRHHCPDGWVSTNINDLSISLNEPYGVKTLAIQLIPTSPRIKEAGKPLEISFDISLEGEKPWAEIKPLLQNQIKEITFFQTKFSFSNILCDSSDKNVSLPRLTPHPGGVTGFLLCLPLPENYLSTAAAFDQVIENCITVAKNL